MPPVQQDTCQNLAGDTDGVKTAAR
jgi:hypothetical protein